MLAWGGGRDQNSQPFNGPDPQTLPLLKCCLCTHTRTVGDLHSTLGLRSAFSRIGPLSLHQRTLGKCLMNSSQKCADVQIPAASYFCPSWLCIWFGHICTYGDASLIYPEHEKALLFLHLSQGCIYEGVTIWTGTQKLANTQ